VIRNIDVINWQTDRRLTIDDDIKPISEMVCGASRAQSKPERIIVMTKLSSISIVETNKSNVKIAGDENRLAMESKPFHYWRNLVEECSEGQSRARSVDSDDHDRQGSDPSACNDELQWRVRERRDRWQSNGSDSYKRDAAVIPWEVIDESRSRANNDTETSATQTAEH
jgi:hypothetical protein